MGDLEYRPRLPHKLAYFSKKPKLGGVMIRSHEKSRQSYQLAGKSNQSRIKKAMSEFSRFGEVGVKLDGKSSLSKADTRLARAVSMSFPVAPLLQACDTQGPFAQ